MPLLIAVSGKLGSGKDYIVENLLLPLLHSDLRVSKMAFADHIKICVASEDGFPIDTVLTGSKDPAIRRKLQLRGTEEGRDRYGEDIWVTTLSNWISLRQIRGEKLDVVLITDCRFHNEGKWIEDQGGLLIRVSALDRHDLALDAESHGDPDVRRNIATHSSETALDTYKFMYTIDNTIGNKDVKCELEKIIYRFLNVNLNYTGLWKLS
jgi:hypothetical protein